MQPKCLAVEDKVNKWICPHNMVTLPFQMCAVLAELIQRFHILISLDLHTALCGVALEQSVVSDLSSSAHGWAGTDGQSPPWCSRHQKLMQCAEEIGIGKTSLLGECS